MNFERGESAVDRHRRRKRERERIQEEWDALDAEAGVKHTTENDNTADDTDTDTQSYQYPAKTWEPSSSRSQPEKPYGEHLEQDRTEQLAELNAKLRVIESEIAELDITSVHQYGQMIDMLVHENNLSPEDAMRILNHSPATANLSYLNRRAAIRETRQAYFGETSRGMGKSR